jgi:pimeloyl-ACP methyl ester carboxylesterase
MHRVELADVALAYDLRGRGESVALIHHGAGVDWFAPLCEEPALASRFGLLRYHRAEYGRSSKLGCSDADTFFGHELPALRQWVFGPDEAKRITQPVLAVVGEHSDTRFHQRQELLREWLPAVEPYVLPNAGHLMHLDNGRGLAHALADFFARHPIP